VKSSSFVLLQFEEFEAVEEGVRPVVRERKGMVSLITGKEVSKRKWRDRKKRRNDWEEARKKEDGESSRGFGGENQRDLHLVQDREVPSVVQHLLASSP